MKIFSVCLGILLALGLAGCSAGVSVGSASYNSGPQGEKWCSRSYSAGVDVPGGPGAGGSRECISHSYDDDD